MQDAAEHLGVSWGIVKDIYKRYLQKHFAKPALQNVRHIGIDEICVGRGYRFLTLVLDLDTGEILFAGGGKKAAALDPFWRRLGLTLATKACKRLPRHFGTPCRNKPQRRSL